MGEAIRRLEQIEHISDDVRQQQIQHEIKQLIEYEPLEGEDIITTCKGKLTILAMVMERMTTTRHNPPTAEDLEEVSLFFYEIHQNLITIFDHLQGEDQAT